MAYCRVELLLVALMLSSQVMPAQSWGLGDVIGAVVGGAVAVAVAPAALAAAGFTAGGVAAGSLAASTMTATTAAGSTFAMLQSAGAAGVGIKTAMAGAAAGVAAVNSLKDDDQC